MLSASTCSGLSSILLKYQAPLPSCLSNEKPREHHDPWRCVPYSSTSDEHAVKPRDLERMCSSVKILVALFQVSRWLSYLSFKLPNSLLIYQSVSNREGRVKLCYSSKNWEDHGIFSIKAERYDIVKQNCLCICVSRPKCVVSLRII